MKTLRLRTLFKNYVNRVGDLREFDANNLRDPDLKANYEVAEKAANKAALALGTALDNLLTELPPFTTINDAGKEGLQEIYVVAQKLRKGSAL